MDEEDVSISPPAIGFTPAVFLANVTASLNSLAARRNMSAGFIIASNAPSIAIAALVNSRLPSIVAANLESGLSPSASFSF